MSGRRRSLTPEHYEALRLSGPTRLGLWAAAVVFAVAGVAVGALVERTTASGAAAGLLLSLGGIGLVAAYRLSTFETLVTSHGLQVGWGGLATTVPRWAVDSPEVRPATGWRRLYAPEEVVLSAAGSGRSRPLVVPSADPAELVAALGHGGAADRTAP